MANTSLNKKRLIINLVVILCVTALAFVYLFVKGTIKKQDIVAIKFYNYIIVFLFFLLAMLILSMVDFIIYRTFTKDMPYYRCATNTLLGNLGSSITPFRSGHFPLMIYYQHSAGVKIEDTATGLVKCQIIYCITAIVLYFVLTIALAVAKTTTVFNGKTVSLYIVLLIGLIFNTLVFVAIIVLSFSKRMQNWFFKVLSKLMFKLKKIQDKDAYILEKKQRMELYKQELTIIGRGWYKYILPVILYFIYMILSNSYQYISYLLFTGKAFSLNEAYLFYTLSLASLYITNVIPLPGGFGTSEIVFTLIFKNIIPEGTIGSVLVLYRFSSYYIAVALEVVLFIVVSAIIQRKKAKL